MAWLGTWKYRHKITIDSSKIDTSDLSHFPVLVSLSTTAGSGNDDVSDIFDELGSDTNRKKIAFTKADGVTQLYGEIEKWDDANEKAWIWVSRSGWTIDYDADTEFYIYFDSSQSDNTTYIGDTDSTPAQNVWDSNFKMVQHMADATTSTIKDSTSNNNDGTKKVANEPIEATGKIGKGQDFDGANDYIDIGAAANYNWTDYITLEAWIYFVGGNQCYIDGWSYNGDAGWIIQRDTNNTYFQIYRGGVKTSYNANPADGWHHIVGVYDGANVKIYIDGEVGSVSVATTGAFTAPNDYMSIGIYHYTYSGSKFANPCANMIDEVRISNSGRSAAWIKASYNAQTDALIKDYAAVETLVTFIPTMTIF